MVIIDTQSRVQYKGDHYLRCVLRRGNPAWIRTGFGKKAVSLDFEAELEEHYQKLIRDEGNS